MKKFYMVAMFLVLQSQVSHADLAQDLRELRGTISETSRTSKELSGLAGSYKDSDSSQRQANTIDSRAEIKEGDALIARIDNIKLYQAADKKSNVLAKLSKRDELIYMGYVSNGFYSVNANGNEGWVEKILVKRH